MTTAGPLLNGSIEVDLEIRLRQNDGANVPPHHDDATSSPNSPLLLREGLAYARVGRDGRDVGVHLRPADMPGDVLTIGADSILPPIVNRGPGDVNLDSLGESGDGLLIGDVDPVLKSNPGDGPVHGTCVEVSVAQELGQEPPDGALP